MPIRRKHDNDPDWMARLQDEELISLERRISALYDEAKTEVSDEFERFYTQYEAELIRRQELVESGELSEEAYAAWCRHNVFRSARYTATLQMLTDVLVNADVAAMALVNDELPLVLAESYDFVSSLGFEAADKAGITVGTFQIYNAESVQAIIRDNPDLLPSVDLPEDELWNRNHINREITQAIIQGDSMPQIAQRLQRVAQMDDNAAIRNARTSMTAAENLGRTESASRLRQRGVPITEIWSATKDSRTRDSHLLLDGTTRDEKTGKFGVGIIEKPYLRFPADPEGQAKEIYNCRCRLNVNLLGIDHSHDDEIYERFMQENYPEDWQKIQERRADRRTGEYRREQERLGAIERQRRLREERQANQRSFRTATNREEAMELLNDLGFSKISDDFLNIDEGMLLENVNALSRLNDRFHAITEGMELRNEDTKEFAYVLRSDEGGSIALNLSRQAYNPDVSDHARAVREFISDNWWMPASEDNYNVVILTHEYGHILQNEITRIDMANTGDSLIWARIYNRQEICHIAEEMFPDFDLFANLSEYAMKDDAEFFAECFMNSQCGQPNQLGLAMQEFLRRRGYDAR